MMMAFISWWVMSLVKHIGFLIMSVSFYRNLYSLMLLLMTTKLKSSLILTMKFLLFWSYAPLKCFFYLITYNNQSWYSLILTMISYTIIELCPLKLTIQHYVIKFVSDLRQVGGFFLFPPSIKHHHDITEILLQVALKAICQSNLEHINFQVC